jgi:diguanylate cyclase (GGDEF)-like protein
VRSSDAVSRRGGDEFVVLLSEITHSDQAARCAEKILKALSAAHDVGGQELRITASVGISVYPEDGLDPDALLKSADAAMYEAKKTGRSRYLFSATDGRATG